MRAIAFSRVFVSGVCFILNFYFIIRNPNPDNVSKLPSRRNRIGEVTFFFYVCVGGIGFLPC